MLNSTAVRVLLGAMLCCVPVAAMIDGGNPGPTIRVGGAVSGGGNHFVVAEKSLVSISVQANPGDLIWVYATGPDGASLTLMLTQPDDGRAYGEFLVPAGTGGRFYKIHALSHDMDGQIFEAAPVVIEVKKAASLNDPAKK
jgi:hypothetical protein